MKIQRKYVEGGSTKNPKGPHKVRKEDIEKRQAKRTTKTKYPTGWKGAEGERGKGNQGPIPEPSGPPIGKIVGKLPEDLRELKAHKEYKDLARRRPGIPPYERDKEPTGRLRRRPMPKPRPRPMPEPGPRDENKWRDWARQRNLEEKRKLDHDPQSIEKKKKKDPWQRNGEVPNVRYGGKTKAKGATKVKFPKAKHPNIMKEVAEKNKKG